MQDFVFPSRTDSDKHVSMRQYARLVGDWVEGIGLGRLAYGTHSLRRTKVALIYKRTGTCEQCRSCSTTPSWKARCATWASMPRMRSRCLKEPRYDAPVLLSTLMTAVGLSWTDQPDCSARPYPSDYHGDEGIGRDGKRSTAWSRHHAGRDARSARSGKRKLMKLLERSFPQRGGQAASMTGHR